MKAKLFRPLFISFALALPVAGFALSESPQSFNFQGRLLNLAGTAGLEEEVNFKFEILDPSGSCLLYSERQSIDLTGKDGLFSLSIGSTVGAAKRTTAPDARPDPGLRMAMVFKNEVGVQTRAVGVSCPSGYTPTAGDVRLLRVTVTPDSTGIPETLVPDQTIGSVGQALVAETLQGFGPLDFIQKDPIYITDTNVRILFGSSGTAEDASSLHHHDGRYAVTGSGSAQSFGSGGFTSSGSGSVGTSVRFTNTVMSVQSTSDASVGLAIRGNSGTQSGDLLQVQSSAGTKIAGILS